MKAFNVYQFIGFENELTIWQKLFVWFLIALFFVVVGTSVSLLSGVLTGTPSGDNIPLI